MKTAPSRKRLEKNTLVILPRTLNTSEAPHIFINAAVLALWDGRATTVLLSETVPS